MAMHLRGGMNREQFGVTSKEKDQDDGDKEYYFDCTILDKL
jgi:hypothetical protein